MSTPPSAGALAFIAATTCLSLGGLYYVQNLGHSASWLYRYVCLVPVAFAAYQYGLLPGLILSSFCALAFLPQLYWRFLGYGLTFPTIELIAFIILLNTFAYFIADMGAALRARETLMSAVSDWETLIAKTSSMREILTFILDQARGIMHAETAALLLRNPLDAEWELITEESKIPFPAPSAAQGTGTILANWLLELKVAMILNEMEQDPRFQTQPEPITGSLSLLARPLTQSDGGFMGLLVVLNRSQGGFARRYLHALDQLVARSEKALEQAGVYAQTDLTLARRVKQLGAIQRTAQQLNALLDPQQIVAETLDCALEITGGQAALVCVQAHDFPQCWRTRGTQWNEEQVPQMASEAQVMAQQLHQGMLFTGKGDAPLPALLARTGWRLLTPIRREDRTFGLVVVEGTDQRTLDETSLPAVEALAHHTSIALENVRLFEAVRKEREQASLIIHSVADGLFTTDPDGRILTFNPAAERIIGRKAADSAGRHCCEVLHCSDADDTHHTRCPLTKAIEEKETVRDERQVITRPKGSKRVLSLSAAPLMGTQSRLDGAVLLFRDITEQDELDRLQRELIAATSHQLRSPLAHISAVAEMLVAEAGELTADRQRDYLAHLQTQSQHLADFTDRMLSLYQLESGHQVLQPRPLPVTHLVNRVVEQWQPIASWQRLMIDTPDQSLWILADENAVETVLNNLIDNAIKYAPEDTKVVISARAQENGRVAISVEDQGPGIAAEHQAKVFDRFYRVDGSDAQSVYGHGLGLYIAKRLVEALGGEIWLDSEPGAGSRFTLALPGMEASYEREDSGRR